MPYRISKADIENIAEVLPDAYVLDSNGEMLELVLQGTVDPQTVLPVATVINEEHVEEYRKVRRQQLLEEVREVQSFNKCVRKRVLAQIVNDAISSIHS